ncbi:MAG: hypothetical protein ABR559_05175 [Gemmatimonadota bacterium]
MRLHWRRWNRPPRWVFALGLLAACGDGEGPLGFPGGRDGTVLQYVTPRLQVVSAGAPTTVTLRLVVLREARNGALTPLAGARLRATRDRGQGGLASPVLTTNARGEATVEIAMPAGADKTMVTVALEDDRRSYLPFDVVSAPVVPVTVPVGAIRELDVPRDGALLRLAVAPGSEYIVIPHQTDRERSGVPYRLLFAGDAPSPGSVATGAAALAEPFARAELETETGHVVAGAIDPGGLELAAGVPGAVNIKSCRITADRLAPLRYRGRNVAIYVDAPFDAHQARIDSLGQAFDDDIVPTNTALFGQMSDLDGNGLVYIIMSPELQDHGGSYCDSIRNVRVEAFYAAWNPTDPIDRPLATLAHEHQHVINAGHHFRTRGDIGDERWLNEGMSYAAEGLHGYWAGALVRVWQFLNGQNTGLSQLPLEYATGFNDEYMMFLLYLRDRFGSGTYLALGLSGRKGDSNVERVTGVAFEDLLRDWFVASAISNRGVTDDPRYNYTSINLHGMAAEIAACRCIPLTRFGGMALEPLLLSTPFDVLRSLDRADADYYQLVPAPGAGARTIDLYYDAYGRQTVGLILVRTR